ncbi:hypothetical protein [Nocardioides sp. ChNu-99]|uniref:hypothetical protein n=1 Tax=Nocardioides sp. ChNu-99 TaxID=2839897 RepID=UPI002404DE77|nr:hypothetical protein [Nocardioides sp. ChNu-99]MDF9714711.1 hypothetical protein [Nocardioides sp. ChNu-99]
MVLDRTRLRTPLAGLALVATLALAACGDGDTGDDAARDRTTPSTSGATPSAGDDMSATPGGTTYDEVVTAAVADLAEREGVDPAEVTVVSDDAVEWRSGALGCPSAGGMYTQAVVPGRRVVLAVEGRDFAYHGPAEGAVSYCASPEAPAAR